MSPATRTALRAPAIKKLTADDGPLQPSLLDEQDPAETASEPAAVSASPGPVTSA